MEYLLYDIDSKKIIECSNFKVIKESLGISNVEFRVEDIECVQSWIDIMYNELKSGKSYKKSLLINTKPQAYYLYGCYLRGYYRNDTYFDLSVSVDKYCKCISGQLRDIEISYLLDLEPDTKFEDIVFL